MRGEDLGHKGAHLMARRSNRFIFAYWDDRDEELWAYLRRGSRCLEHMKTLPQLWDAREWKLRHIYTYDKRVRLKRIKTDQAMPNHLFYRTPSSYRPGRGTSEFELLTTVMKMIIVSWEPYVCGVTTKALKALFPDPGPFREAWILYVHPMHAAFITPPDVPVVERTPDGGLLMAAATKPFDAEKVDHVEAARRIGQAVRHLNVERPHALAPWPPFIGYMSMNYYEPRDEAWLGRALHKVVPDQDLYPDANNRQVVGRIGPD